MVQSWPSYTGESSNYSVDYSVLTGRLSTTVSSVTWSVECGTASISNETLSGSVASALVTTNTEGHSLIKLVAELVDGQKDVFYFKIKTLDPTCKQSSSGRY